MSPVFCQTHMMLLVFFEKSASGDAQCIMMSFPYKYFSMKIFYSNQLLGYLLPCFDSILELEQIETS